MRRSALALAALLVATPVVAQDVAAVTPPPITVEAINAADLTAIPAQYAPPPAADEAGAEPPARHPDPAVVRLQVLLDRAGASPGVIDGFDGDNVRKAVVAFELMHGLPTDGVLDPDMLAALGTSEPVIGQYQVMPQDLEAIGPAIPADYAEQAKMSALGYTSITEELGERFHMDVDLLAALNPGAAYAPGDRVFVAAYGPDRTGEVARIEADKSLRQVRAYDAAGQLLVAYPATIGSEDNPSPTGTHIVEGVAPMPTYTYNPAINFQQGDNTSVLTLPPGPNGPVGSMWIDLSEPTFGIHGTPEPSKIDKTASHGCVRLTNWDANELAKMVKPGVPVDFVG
jgi:lipoprotein-anchoring transpeptidase ErfK/SrfK